MKQTVPILLWCLFSATAFSQKQGKDLFATDTTISYANGTTVYTFDLEGQKQGLYWGDLVPSEMPLGNVRIRVRNNTRQIAAIRRVEAGDGTVLYLPVKPYDYLLPEDYMEIRPVFLPKAGPFTKSLRVSYQAGTEERDLFITTWGALWPTAEQAEKARQAAGQPAEQAPGTKEYRILVKRGNALITDQCSLIIWRDGRPEILRPVTDSAEYAYFSFPASGDQVFKASIASRDFGRMETQLVCSRGSSYEEFIRPDEKYYYNGVWRTRYTQDSNRYAMAFDARGSAPDSICDSIRQVLDSSGVRLRSSTCSQLQFAEIRDVVPIERQLLNGPHAIRLLPLIREEGKEQPGQLSNRCTIVFHDSVPGEWINEQLNKPGIATFSKDPAKDNRYSVSFVHSTDTGYTAILDKLWGMKEVLRIEQHVYQATEGLD